MIRKENNHIGEGELTGHFHLAQGNNIIVLENESTNEMELHAPEGCSITHQEHKQMEIPPGEYEVGGVLEYDPAAEEARQVQD
jgi:hypothetical protein